MTVTPLSIKNVKITASLFLAGWVAACAFVIHLVYGFDWTIAIADSVVSNLLFALACVVISNILAYYQAKDEKLLFIVLLTGVLASIIAFLSKYALVYIFAKHNYYISFINLTLIFRGMLAFVMLLWCALANILWYRLEEQNEAQQRLLATQNLAKEAELNKLRHQLQPHFLFNSLNSVYALTIVNPKEAGTMITKLAAFLRGTLKRDDEIWVSVSDEMDYIGLYLDIEKVRFSHRLNIDIQVEEDTSDLKLPGTLLQPIVENAIKFGLYNTSTAVTIAIKVFVESHILNIIVSNPFDPEMQLAEGTGFGLSAIKRRLYLLFADSSLLQTQTLNNNLFITQLKIPQSYDQNHIN